MEPSRVKAGLSMFRNVGLKKLSILFLTVGCLSYGVEHDGKGSTDPSKTAAADKSPDFTKFISLLSTFKQDGETIRRFSVAGKPEEFADKKSPKTDAEAVVEFAKEAKNYRDGLEVCAVQGQGHAEEFKNLIDRCMNELVNGFVTDRTQAKWELRGGETNPMQITGATMAQCRNSIGAITQLRKDAKISDLTGDVALLEKLDAMLAKFEIKPEAFAKIEPLALEKEIIGLAEKAKENIKSGSCSVPKFVEKKAEPKKKEKKKKEPKEKDKDAEQKAKQEKERKAQEAKENEEALEKDPPALNPVPRTGPTATGAGGGGAGSDARDGQPQPQVPPQGFPQGGLGGAIDPSAINPNFAGFDPNALLDAIQRPDGARVGGSPSRTTGAPSFQAPPISPGGGGNQSPPQQPEQPQQQQAQGPMPIPPQQAPIIIGDPNGSSKKDESPARVATAPAAPAKEDSGAAERKGFNDGYNQAMAMFGRMGQGGAQGANAGTTGAKLTAGNFSRGGRGGSMARGRRSSGARSTPAFAGTGRTMRRGPSTLGRGSVSTP